MKRYLLFAGPLGVPQLGIEFTPSGGWGDFRGDYDTTEQALAATSPGDWWHIVDLTTGNIVVSG